MKQRYENMFLEIDHKTATVLPNLVHPFFENIILQLKLSHKYVITSNKPYWSIIFLKQIMIEYCTHKQNKDFLKCYPEMLEYFL
jgi:hypothetical protein